MALKARVLVCKEPIKLFRLNVRQKGRLMYTVRWVLGLVLRLPP
jgi:hypothetical protein